MIDVNRILHELRASDADVHVHLEETLDDGQVRAITVQVSTHAPARGLARLFPRKKR